MITLREAAQQALDALDWHSRHGANWSGIDEATEALRAALATGDNLSPTEPDHFAQLIAETEADPKSAQALADGRRWVKEQFYASAEPVQEPVAWIQPDHLQKARQAPFLSRVEPTQRFPDFVPLYLAPPQRKPLTDEEIAALIESMSSHWEIVPPFTCRPLTDEAIADLWHQNGGFHHHFGRAVERWIKEQQQ